MHTKHVRKFQFLSAILCAAKPETVLYGKITEQLQRFAKGHGAPSKTCAEWRVFARQRKNFRLRRFVKRTKTYPIRSRFVLSRAVALREKLNRRARF